MRQRGIAEQPSVATLSLNIHAGALVEKTLVSLCLPISDCQQDLARGSNLEQTTF
jgi:hypothetical protein